MSHHHRQQITYSKEMKMKTAKKIGQRSKVCGKKLHKEYFILISLLQENSEMGYLYLDFVHWVMKCALTGTYVRDSKKEMFKLGSCTHYR